MRRPTIALLISCLLIAGTVPIVTAQSPSPGAVSGRVEVPELGVTVTFPEDWELDVRLEQDQAPAELGPDARQWRILDAEGPKGSDEGDDSCTVMLYRPTELTPTDFFERLRTDEGPDAPQVEALDEGFFRLAGPGTVLGGEVDMAFYLLEADDTLALLWCMSETPPADYWLPIALSLQLQPVDDSDRERIAADLPVIDGSTSTEPLRMFIVCAVLDVRCDWVEWFDGSRAVVPTEGSSFDVAITTSGTHGSYVALAEGRADLILTARMPSDDEVRLAESNGVGFDISPIALDAFVLLVNASNPVEGLDLDQVRGIFSGAITDWAKVGGDARPIQPYQRNETSGSQVLMERLVMRGTPMIDAPDMMLMSMMAPFDAISHDPDGIGYSVYYFATHMLATDAIDLLAIEGSEPDPATIASGEYPLVTEVYAVLPSGLPQDSTARMLRDLLVTDAGRSIIEESGYVPLPT